MSGCGLTNLRVDAEVTRQRHREEAARERARAGREREREREAWQGTKLIRPNHRRVVLRTRPLHATAATAAAAAAAAGFIAGAAVLPPQSEFPVQNQPCNCIDHRSRSLSVGGDCQAELKREGDRHLCRCDARLLNKRTERERERERERNESRATCERASENATHIQSSH